MLKDREWICRRVPHAGAMCLLDEVLFWNADRVGCLSRAHRAASNPLRAHGRLGAACGVEFAAQAMALHGALVAQDMQTRPRIGYLASLRGVTMNVARLDDIDDDLVATAERVGGDESAALYRFALSAGRRTLISGRATIVLGPVDVNQGISGVSR